ncbi:MAG: hypothetical protein WD054_05315, partial [Gemmatimonadota bacterium]
RAAAGRGSPAVRPAPAGGATPDASHPHALERARRPLKDLTVRHPVIVALALAALHVVLALLTFEPQPHTGGDNAAYISLARSLLERGAYVELWDPAQRPHTKYPPVFPGILAIALAAGLKPFVQLKLVVLAFSATAVAFSFLWIRARARPMLALGIGLLLAVAPGVLREGRWILSDVPFWCFTMIALWAFQNTRPDEWKHFAIAAVAVLLAYFTRSAGLPLALAGLGWLAWRRHWRQFAVLAVLILVPAALWWLRGRAFGPAGYVSEFWLIDPYRPDAGTIGIGDLFARVFENQRKYVALHLPILIGGMQSAWLHLLGILAFGLAFFGWALRVWRRRGTASDGMERIGVAELFMPLYLGLIFVWPAVWSGERFLLPVLPLLLFYAGDLMSRLFRRFATRHAFVAGAATVLLILMLATPGLARGLEVGRACTALYRAGDRYPCLGGAHWDDFFALAEWTRTALPPDAVVLSRKPRLYYVLSGRRGVIYPSSSDPGRFFETVRQTGARYVVYDALGGLSETYLRPVVAGRPESFCLIRVVEPSGTALLGILPDGSTRAQASDGATFSVCDDSFVPGAAAASAP